MRNIFFDILPTDLKATEGLLIRSFETLPLSFLILKAASDKPESVKDFHIVYINKAAAAELGLNYFQEYGGNPADLIGNYFPLDALSFLVNFYNNNTAQISSLYEVNILPGDEHHSAVEINLLRENNYIAVWWMPQSADKKLQKIIERQSKLLKKINSEFFQQKLFHRSVTQDKENLIKTLEYSLTGSYLIDLESGTVQGVSEILRIFGLSTISATNDLNLIFKNIHRDDKDNILARFNELIRDRIPVNEEFRIVLPHGKIKYIETTAIPILNEENTVTGIFGISTDITKRRIFQKILENNLFDLERSNRELLLLAKNVSHDLKDPLSSICGILNLLENKHRDVFNDDDLQYLSFAISETKKLQDLIEEILSSARADSADRIFDIVDCNQIVHHVLNIYYSYFEKSRLMVKTGKLPLIKGNPLQIRQLFQNLISNALKNNKSYPMELSINCSESKHDWIFSIKDNGIGINKKMKKRILDFFSQNSSSSNFADIGIGLHICKNVIDRHRGRIWLESAPQKGSTFYFSLPKP